MLKINLRGQVRQTVLPKWKPLLPVFEAVMNAFQATQDASKKKSHKIIIDIERDADLGVDNQAPIRSFKITDTGVGFNDDNYDSFNTAFSDYKMSRGGKGLGRFIWLKAFEKVTITSVFTEEETTGPLQRKFVFDDDYDADKTTLSPSKTASHGTEVHLINYKEPYRSECPKTAEQITQRLIEHFLLVFLQEDCPAVEVHDQGLKYSANNIFEKEFKASASTHEIRIKDQTFVLNGFRLSASRTPKHRLLYAANQRAVVSDVLSDYIPNLTGRLIDEEDNPFTYLAIVQSPYLNQRVNNARTDFDIGHTNDGEAEQPSLFAEEIRRSDIRDACIERIEKDLQDVITSINEAKSAKINKYVQEEAPQYKILLKYEKDFIGQIPPSASKIEIETALHKELFQREQKMKQEGSKIIKEADKIEDYEGYRKRFSDFMENYNELGVSALAQYVSHRKIILDFLERAVSKDPGTSKYPPEKAIHHLIFPMKGTTDDVPYYQQNLWMIDERLTYHSFIASDKPLSSIGEIENTSLKRPDIFIFDRKIAFAEGDQPINSIVVVEFKKADRNDYTPEENPLSQCFDMVSEIRSGRFKDAKGRPISVSTEKIPAYCYVICDLTPSMDNVLLDIEGAEKTPDQQGYYGYHRRRQIYYEVIDYNKLLRDAKKRNRVFFDRLNILGNQ